MSYSSLYIQNSHCSLCSIQRHKNSSVLTQFCFDHKHLRITEEPGYFLFFLWEEVWHREKIKLFELSNLIFSEEVYAYGYCQNWRFAEYKRKFFISEKIFRSPHFWSKNLDKVEPREEKTCWKSIFHFKILLKFHTSVVKEKTINLQKENSAIPNLCVN